MLNSIHTRDNKGMRRGEEGLTAISLCMQCVTTASPEGRRGKKLLQVGLGKK